MVNTAPEPRVTSRVFILYTGGTIGMAPQEPSRPGSALVPQPVGELLRHAQALLQIPGVELAIESFEPPLDSSNLRPDDWVRIARRLAAIYEDFDGFVVLHGTDTMAYTASALAFMFENLGKPVVLTGSQVPISARRTDATLNFLSALSLAAYRTTQLPCVPEVVIVFADKILRGCRARKMSISSWAAFDSPNCPALGHIGEQIRVHEHLLQPPPPADARFRVNPDLFTRVLDVNLFPGMRGELLARLLGAVEPPGAVVLRTFGAGNAPDDAEFLDALGTAIRSGLTVVNVTSCPEGTVGMGRYHASNGMLDRGVVSGLDLTPEAALTKLMWTLANRVPAQVAGHLQVNQRGEMSENLFDLNYGPAGSAGQPIRHFREFRTPDRRFERAHLTRAVVRIAGLRCAPTDSTAAPRRILVFMNHAAASPGVTMDPTRCVAEFTLAPEAGSSSSPGRLAHEIERGQAITALGADDVLLSVFEANGTPFRFESLSLALFARA